MQEEISFIDFIGIASFIWSIITFYIGYRWYKDGATKDALIARLTAEAEILRQEIAAISSADGGKKREKLAVRRDVDRHQLNRLNLFYRSAFQFFYTKQKAGQAYIIFLFGVSIAIFVLLVYFSGANTFLYYVIAAFAAGLLLGPNTLIFFPVYLIIRNYIIRSRLNRIQRLLVEQGFSYQEVLAAKNWLNQQERSPDDHKLKHTLGELLHERLAQLENIGIHTPRPVTTAQMHNVELNV